MSSPSEPSSPRIRKKVKTNSPPKNTQAQNEVLQPQHFYDKNIKLITTVEERIKYSKTKDLRIFNNWIKSVLIQKTVKELRETRSNPLAVLEIGCGKGGDLVKWNKASIGNKIFETRLFFYFFFFFELVFFFAPPPI
jgi:mRNA (guanine-N7-)-methyltransferase